jgi:para-nitrobenzyl esterase
MADDSGVRTGGGGMHANMRRLAVLSLSLLVWLTMLGAPAQAAQRGRYLDPIFSTFRTTNLTYGRAPLADGSFATLKLDLYRPSNDTASNRPVLIFVHGGGSASDKSLKRNRSVANGFAQRGFVAAAINYRPGLSSGATRDAQYDVRAAVRWFRANAVKYRINPNWIFLMGSSAGAMNALNVAFHPEDPGNSGNPGYSSAVAAALSVGGFASEASNIGSMTRPSRLPRRWRRASTPRR